MSTICSPFSSQLITSNFSSTLTVLSPMFHLYWIRWCRFTFLTHFGNRNRCCWSRGTSAVRLYHQHNQSTHVTDGKTLASLSASFQNKKTVAKVRSCHVMLKQKLLHYHPGHIPWNWKLTCKFEKWHQISYHVKANSWKRNRIKQDQPVYLKRIQKSNQKELKESGTFILSSSAIWHHVTMIWHDILQN
jgi:hypothetical protein